MSGAAQALASAQPAPGAHGRRFEAGAATRESPWVRRTILTLGLGFFALFLLMPLATVFTEALRKGLGVYVAALVEPDALSALRLTLVAALIAVPVNLVLRVRGVGRHEV